MTFVRCRLVHDRSSPSPSPNPPAGMTVLSYPPFLWSQTHG